ncbi:polysaccharide pyruvyl transferase family protein [Paraprevotella xylaniphila]|uniref:polysaccharide pyruvyl transferase family protein n=1 Tax=Paraprevotella xylaniphila TaxID=454155 RepID=UPI002666EA81|nr:polysaccharide pyruvyl transferase family protein [Paraprevotella xylaniphila]
MSKTFYSAYTCKNNLGDLIINKMQIEEYSKYGEVYVDFTGMPDNFKNILLNSDNPNIKDFTDTYGQPYRGKHFLQVINLLKKEGFTHFTKSPGPYAVLSLPLKKLIIRLIGALGYMAANFLGLKVFAFGIDLDYISNQPKWLKWFNIKYFSLYNALGLRSLKNYEECKNDLNNTKYVPDMAFLYPKQTCINTNRKQIAFSFRHVTETETLLAELKEILSIFVPKGYAVDFIFQVEEDRSFAQVLAKNLKEYNLNVSSQCIWYENLNTYSKYDYVFSNRLHVLLLAAKYGAIPFALISKDLKERKISNIFNSISLGYLMKHIGFTNKEQWIELLSNREAIKHEVNNALEYQKQICIKRIKDFYQQV